MAGKVSEVKLWGRGGNAWGHRNPSCKGKQIAQREFSRADRRAARAECRAARLGWAEGAEITVAMMISEDEDAHVLTWEAAGFSYYYGGYEDFDDDSDYRGDDYYGDEDYGDQYLEI